MAFFISGTQMKMTAKRRAVLTPSTFGLPAERKYPMPDKSHAANAKARATQQVGKSITPVQKAAIDTKANKVLGTGLAMAKRKRTVKK